MDGAAYWDSPLSGFDSRYTYDSHPSSASPCSISAARTPPDYMYPPPEAPLSFGVKEEERVKLNWVDFYADILCHLWFGPLDPQEMYLGSNHAYPSSSFTPHLSNLPIPTSPFRNFVQTVINTTAVSEAVLILSLWYVNKIRRKNKFAQAAAGSEYRLCATGMMLANKYLDDNTYTSRTWSSLTSLPLHEMNLMEVEFLGALEHRVGITDVDYLKWTAYLNTLAMSINERNSILPISIVPQDFPFTFQAPYPSPTYNHMPPAPVSIRARSSSPLRNQARRFTPYDYPALQQAEGSYIPPPQVSTRKRSAEESFMEDPNRTIRRVRSSQYDNISQQPHHLLPNGPAGSARRSSWVGNGPFVSRTRRGEGQLFVPPGPGHQNFGHPNTPMGYGQDQGYLQQPYSYQMSEQPRPEDLAFYTLTASPIEDEYLYEHDDHYAKSGKPRIIHQGQYQTELPNVYYPSLPPIDGYLPELSGYQNQTLPSIKDMYMFPPGGVEHAIPQQSGYPSLAGSVPVDSW